MSTLTQELKMLLEKHNATGGILIMETSEGIKMSQTGLSETETLDNLCLAIYYAKSIQLDRQYKEAELPKN